MKKQNTYHFLVSLIIIALLSSCKARFYTPNRNPVPLFKNKGDVYLDASTNLANKYDITAGYAVSNNIGAYVGYGGAKENSSTPHTDSNGNNIGNTSYQYRGDMLNMGLGYFLNQEQSSEFRFELFGDIALGSYRNTVTNGASNDFLNGQYTRIGIMPNIGYTSLDNKVCFAYSARFSNIRFSDASYSNYNYWSGELKRLNRQTNYNMLEHCLLFRAGSENIKFQLQFALYHGLNSDPNNTNAIPWFNSSIMMGLVINMNALDFH